MKTGKAKTVLLDLLLMLVGSAVYAVEVNAFTAPNNIAAGGVTGIATMLNYLFGTPIGLISFLINAPLVVWAVVEIGYKLVAKTMVAIVLTSVMIDLFSHFVPAYQGDPLWWPCLPGPARVWASLLSSSGGPPPAARTWWPGCWAGGCPMCPWAS